MHLRTEKAFVSPITCLHVSPPPRQPTHVSPDTSYSVSQQLSQPKPSRCLLAAVNFHMDGYSLSLPTLLLADFDTSQNESKPSPAPPARIATVAVIIYFVWTLFWHSIPSGTFRCNVWATLGRQRLCAHPQLVSTTHRWCHRHARDPVKLRPTRTQFHLALTGKF